MDILLSDPMSPFWIALATVVFLLILEVLLMVLGFSTSLESGDGPLGEVEAGLGGDFDAGLDIEGLDLDGAELTPALLSDAIARSNEKPVMISPGRSFLDRIGLTRVPVAIWLSAFLLSFGSLGILFQTGLHGLIGFTLPKLEASLLMVPPALYITRFLSEVVGNFFPKIETSAMTMRMLSSHRGETITGPARRGRAAEVRIKDRHGNLHYLMAEPYAEESEIAPGTEVLLVRLRNGDLRILPLS